MPFASVLDRNTNSYHSYAAAATVTRTQPNELVLLSPRVGNSAIGARVFVPIEIKKFRLFSYTVVIWKLKYCANAANVGLVGWKTGFEMTDVLCVFEGGGAKGVAHVGFLKAIESEESFVVQGYAGTSAGAIIAALAASGWTGRELFRLENEVPRSDALALLNETESRNISNLVDFIEPKEWRIINAIKDILNKANIESDGETTVDVGEKIRKSLIRIAIIFVVSAFAAAILAYFVSAVPLAIFAVLISVLAGAVLIVLGYFSGKYKGFASMNEPRRLLEKLIEAKVGRRGGRGVTFEQLAAATGKTLKIVAADIETGRLKLFSAETTPSTVVSDAVVASAAIPLIFKPVLVDGRQYCDGGIVSNLPAWTFDKERMTDQTCLVITCEIAPPKGEIQHRRSLSGLRLLTRVGVTAVFGGAGLNTRGMIRHLELENWASFRVLDFDKTEQQIDLIEKSEELAEIQIELEKHHSNSIVRVRNEIDRVCRGRGMKGCRPRVAYVRHVNLVDAPPAAYHLWACCGYEHDHDEYLILPVDNSLIGETLSDNSNEPRFFDLRDETVKARYLGNGSKSFPRKYLPNGKEWVIVVPLRAKRHSRVSIAVCVDGEEGVGPDADTFLSEVADIIRQHA